MKISGSVAFIFNTGIFKLLFFKHKLLFYDN